MQVTVCRTLEFLLIILRDLLRLQAIEMTMENDNYLDRHDHYDLTKKLFEISGANRMTWVIIWKPAQVFIIICNVGPVYTSY